MSDDNLDFYEDEYLDEQEIIDVLAEYHQRQLMENMTGPTISLVTHAILLTLMFVFIVTPNEAKEPPSIEVSIVELEHKEPPPLPEIPPVDPTEDPEEMDVPELSEAPNTEVGEEAPSEDFIDDSAETADDMPSEEYLDVKVTESILVLTGITGGQRIKGKKGLVDKYGGTKPGQASVSKSLRWLARVQQDNGSWGNDSPAHTGMALLVFLAHGETPLSVKYGETVTRAMQWLHSQVMAKGNLGQKAYGHGIAAYAIAEACGMTGLPMMRAAMEKSIQVIIDGQQAGGGFDYSYAKGARWDLSVSGWQIQALKAAFVAGASNEGLADAITKSVRFLRKTTYANYKFGYSSAGSGGNMTGVGVVGLQLNGASRTKEARGGLKTIAIERLDRYKIVLGNPQKWNEVAGSSLYGWYYDTQAIFNAQGKDWKRWRPVFEKVLIKAQHKDGYWEVNKGHGMGPSLPGRILSTCWSSLQLQVYYRYLPTFNKAKMDKHVDKSLMAALDDENFDDGGVEIQIDDN